VGAASASGAAAGDETMRLCPPVSPVTEDVSELDSAFTLYRRNLGLILAITAVVQVPLALFSYVIYRLTGITSASARLRQLSANGTFTAQQLTDLRTAITTVLGVVLGIGLVQLLVIQPIATAAMTRAVGDVYIDQPATFGAAYRAVGHRIWPVLVGPAVSRWVQLWHGRPTDRTRPGSRRIRGPAVGPSPDRDAECLLDGLAGDLTGAGDHQERQGECQARLQRCTPGIPRPRRGFKFWFEAPRSVSIGESHRTR